jgi:hypothetical protein
MKPAVNSLVRILALWLMLETFIYLAASAEAPVPEAFLTPPASQERPIDLATLTSSPVVTFKFVKVNPLITSNLEHDFVIVNSGSAGINIDHLRSACGCTSAILNGSQTHVGGQLVDPGGKIAVHVKVDLGQFNSGHIVEPVWVYLSGQAKPALTLQIEGEIEKLVQFAPETIDFGRVQAGKRVTIMVTATFDPSFYNRGIIRVPLSNNPDINIDEVAKSDPLSEIDRKMKITYKVTLSASAKLGKFDETVVVRPPKSHLHISGAGLFRISGEVGGDISATPTLIAFGTVERAIGPVQIVRVNGISREALEGLSISTGSTYLTAHFKLIDSSTLAQSLSSSKDSNSASEGQLVIGLTSGAPAGPFVSDVSLRTDSGQTLVLHCYGVVSKN